MPLVRAKQAVFYGGSRRKIGAVFQYDGTIEGNPCIELVAEAEGKQEVKETILPTVEQLREKLNGYGVKFHHSTGIEKLTELVAEAEGKQ
jgi:hypothetical protein